MDVKDTHSFTNTPVDLGVSELHHEITKNLKFDRNVTQICSANV